MQGFQYDLVVHLVGRLMNCSAFLCALVFSLAAAILAVLARSHCLLSLVDMGGVVGNVFDAFVLEGGFFLILCMHARDGY